MNDDPFREQVLLSLLGAGGRSMAIYAAAVMTVLFLLWTLVECFGEGDGDGEAGRASIGRV